MIKYALVCDTGHAFEGWFGGSQDYERQQAEGLVECPVCASRGVRKQVMAPAIAGTKAQAPAPARDGPRREMMMEAMGKVRQLVEAHFDYVGDAFAAEARAIHEGRSEDRGIYGEASPAEVKALVEDGVNVAPLPPAPPKKSDVN